ncbi:MAG TPA: hypothetical protein VFG71_11930 [Nitrospiraceae bacterium]|nr:hypothetical protein [Nitrospiraceae bacterium]
MPPERLFADVRTITAEGEYRLGDRDSKEDGVRLAMEQAKRNALEQVASYLESITVVRDLDITQDEIRSYTAGVVLILNQKAALRLDHQTIVVHVTLTAQVDTDEVVQALAAVKQHEEARGELLALQQEVDQLHLELNAANRALATATTSEQVRTSSSRREQLLSRAQSNAMVAQAWTDWIVSRFLASPYASNGGLPRVQALIAEARQLNPDNPHLYAVEQAVTKQPPAPPRPPTPPVPHTVPFLPRMPSYQVVPRPPAASESPDSRPADPSTGLPPATRRLENGPQIYSPRDDPQDGRQSQRWPQRSGPGSPGALNGGTEE